jgi:hypothetical protein
VPEKNHTGLKMIYFVELVVISTTMKWRTEPFGEDQSIIAGLIVVRDPCDLVVATAPIERARRLVGGQGRGLDDHESSVLSG